MKAHILQPDGSYEKVDRRGKTPLCAQDYFCEKAIREAKEREAEKKTFEKTRVFEPMLSIDK